MVPPSTASMPKSCTATPPRPSSARTLTPACGTGVTATDQLSTPMVTRPIGSGPNPELTLPKKPNSIGAPDAEKSGCRSGFVIGMVLGSTRAKSLARRPLRRSVCQSGEVPVTSLETT
jgi:hypothetical protein